MKFMSQIQKIFVALLFVAVYFCLLPVASAGHLEDIVERGTQFA